MKMDFCTPDQTITGGDANAVKVQGGRPALPSRRRGRRRYLVADGDAGATSGFTLIEILVVLTIIAILAGLIVPRLMDRPEEARRVKARLQLEQIQGALKLFTLDNGTYPTTDQGLEALVRQPTSGNNRQKWRKEGYLEGGAVPADPWGHPFQYLSPGLHSPDFDLWSTGADGQTGGEGANADVESWNPNE